MKITIDVDCTPEEARRFLGLPDVGPMQDQLLAELGRRMMSNLKGMEPEALMKTWLPSGLRGLEDMQKMFWAQANKATSKAPPGKPGKPGETSK